jgi:hypothetical protein
MHRDHEIFVTAINRQRKVRVIFYNGPDNRCFEAKALIPLDYYPGRRQTDNRSCYVFWDPEGENNISYLTLEPANIHKIRLDKDSFEPQDFEKWGRQKFRNWFIKRDWKCLEHSRR